jgi:hypothetical protein
MSRSKTNADDHAENSDVSFISRWSRLKHDNQQGVDKTSKNTAMEKGVSDEERAPLAKILTDEDMPDIATLVADSDYTDFLSPGVSEALRKLALRKLFHSEVFNIRDGLDDYDGDYTHFEKLGSIVTSDMHHQIEMEAKRKAREMLQDKEQLPGDADISVIAADNNRKQPDCVDMTNAVDRDMSKTPLEYSPMDQAKPPTDYQADIEVQALNAVPSFITDNDDNLQNSRSKSADGCETDDHDEVTMTAAEKIIEKDESES